MTTQRKHPQNRHKFDGVWDQALYLYDKVLYWFYHRRDRRRAARFCQRLEPLLRKVAGRQETIRGEACWSLLYEVRRDLQKAIFHRRNEVGLIKRLQKLKPAVPHYGPEDLADRLILLGILYHDSGDIRGAVQSLKEAKSICARKHILFDSSDILKSFEAELRSDRVKKSRPFGSDAKAKPTASSRNGS